MLLEINEVLANLLKIRLAAAKVGVVVHGIHGADIATVVAAVAEKLGQHVYAAAVGSTPAQAAHFSIAPNIESAVAWRNQPDKAGHILVFINSEADKLASLNFLDRLGPRELAEYWLNLAAEGLSANQPQERFWEALRDEAALYQIAMLHDFIRTISERGATDLEAIPTNLWRLGLLNDSHILDANQPPAQRLADNRSLVLEAGQLSENNRRRMSGAVSRAGDSANPRQVATFKALLDYYRRGTQESLRQLDLSDVKDLIVAGRTMPAAPLPTTAQPLVNIPPTPLPPSQPLPPDDEVDGDEETGMGDGYSPTAPRLLERRLSGKQLNRSLARRVVTGEAQPGLRELGDRIRNVMNDPDQSKSELQADGLIGFENEVVAIDNLPRELYRFVGNCCAEDKWGAVVEVEERELRDAVKSAAPSQITAFNPERPDASRFSLFETLRRFDQFLSGPDSFAATIAQLTAARNLLLPHLDLLLASPEVLLGGYPEAVTAMGDYLAAYTKLFRLFREAEPLLHREAHQSVTFVEADLLRLEVIHVLAGDEWKAMLTPLHPFHLWRYHEILQLLNREQQTITPEQQTQLAEVLPDLPHLLHFVVVSDHVAGNASTVLPHAGSIGLLPTYENHTNRYLGSDGISVLGLLLRRWLELTPYSKYQVRLALVDVPDLATALTEVRGFMHTQPGTRVSVDVYYTPVRAKGNDLAHIDYEQEEMLADLMRSGWLEVSVMRFEQDNAFQHVMDELRARPVHIAYIFDQSQFEISDAPRIANLLVSPLVVTYNYEFDRVHQQGTISPSSEAESGLFADYHYVVERASNLPGGQQLRLKMQRSFRSRLANEVIKEGGCLWLAIADRNLIPYAPEEAVPLMERLEGQREVGLWASNYSQTMRTLLDLLNRYNLKPDWQLVVNLVHSYGHIAATGLFSVKANRSQADARTAQQKGLLGTILAAEWYRRTYPGALIASLDSAMARQWLAKRTEGAARADLIGLRFDGDHAIVEVIEVKSTSNDGEVKAQHSRDQVNKVSITGAAVDQLNHTLQVVRSIFSEADEQLFTPARREALRYQLYRESFREQHNPDEQQTWFNVLNRVFSRPSGMSVECRGLAVQVEFESAGLDVSVEHDTDQPLTLTQIGARYIQALIGSPSPADLVPPSSPPTAAPPAQTPGESPMPSPEQTMEEPPTPSSKLAGVALADSDVLVPPEDGQGMAEEEVQTNAVAPTVTLGAAPPPIIPSAVSAGEVTNLTRWTQERSPDLDNELREVARLFHRACEDFRISIIECNPERAVIGPSVLRFYVKLARGQRLDALRTVLEDISREVQHGSLLVSPLPNTNEIALDVPRRHRAFVSFDDALRILPTVNSPEQMPITVGVTPEGKHIISYLDRMPHLLVGGTTGAGKTMFLYTLLLSLLARHPQPDQLRLLLSSSKREDFDYFAGLPHLEAGRVIDRADEAVALISNLVTTEFEQRGNVLGIRGRDIGTYNRNVTTPLQPIVIIVDEFADLVDQFGSQKKQREEFYDYIRRVAQRGRNRGVHLVLCTQRPSADLVPTNIRNLMNSRIALRVNDATASRMILEEAGAERLQRHGDMLYKDEGQTQHLQGYFVDADNGELTRMLSLLVLLMRQLNTQSQARLLQALEQWRS